jgi:hypothetical protein
VRISANPVSTRSVPIDIWHRTGRAARAPSGLQPTLPVTLRLRHAALSNAITPYLGTPTGVVAVR